MDRLPRRTRARLWVRMYASLFEVDENDGEEPGAETPEETEHPATQR
ncbi:hypothetical protein [Haloarcula onubensis]|uniref:Uncharacterized protein n=1 Tax=Haloarcula onubensis TaxID=2950539 RepID=A0ABU2FT87_9EURY|nr:hypothetical protein [Halomicroarcula sp. S3CR25-11]MDS0283639.1 hypothetical protein [Halomicroarcula sp. S3CR25-11]